MKSRDLFNDFLCMDLGQEFHLQTMERAQHYESNTECSAQPASVRSAFMFLLLHLLTFYVSPLFTNVTEDVLQ